MASVLRQDGHLILTSRNWELVRSAGSRLEIADALVEREGRRGLVVYSWQLAGAWNERHRLHVGVALLDDDGGVQPVIERLNFWPFRRRDLVDDLASVGLRVQTTTYADSQERYVVVAQHPR